MCQQSRSSAHQTAGPYAWASALVLTILLIFRHSEVSEWSEHLRGKGLRAHTEEGTTPGPPAQSLTKEGLSDAYSGNHQDADAPVDNPLRTNSEPNAKQMKNLIDSLSEKDQLTGHASHGIEDKAGLQFLVDFGIVGHAKTATTTLMHWIGRHNEVIMPPHEVHGLTFGSIATFASELYKYRSNESHKYGWKAPNDITTPMPRRLIRQYFPDAKLIIGLRHPVKFFESFYNFKVRQGRKMPNAASLVGDSIPAQVLYHAHLAGMGKTNMSTEAEGRLVRPYLPISDAQLKLLGLAGRVHSNDPDIMELRDPHFQPWRMNNRVFLYDVSQPFDSDESRSRQFREDLSNFLDLNTPLPKLVPRNVSLNYHYQIDICDDRFDDLRLELVEIGKAASTWLVDYFIDLSDVSISSPDHFKNILKSWKFDPCVETESQHAM